MNNQRRDLLKLLTVKTETVKLDCLKGTNFEDMEFQLKEMTITQNKEYNEIMRSESKKDRFDKCMMYACKAVMIEPSFFTDDELENMNGVGKAIMDEIFLKIPTIGMTAKEKKYYHAKIEELAEKQVEKEDEVTKEKK